MWARLSVVYRRLPVCASGGVLFLLRGLPWEIEMVVGKLPKMLGKLASWQPFSLSFRWGGGGVTCVCVSERGSAAVCLRLSAPVGFFF